MFTSARSGLRDRSTGVAGRRREARRRLLRIKATEDARGVLRNESFADGGAQFRRSIIIQEAQELGGLRCRGLASLESGIEKLFTFRNGAGETPSGCRSPGLALTFQQGYLVGGIRDKLVAIIGAAMARNFG